MKRHTRDREHAWTQIYMDDTGTCTHMLCMHTDTEQTQKHMRTQAQTTHNWTLIPMHMGRQRKNAEIDTNTNTWTQIGTSMQHRTHRHTYTWMQAHTLTNGHQHKACREMYTQTQAHTKRGSPGHRYTWLQTYKTYIHVNIYIQRHRPTHRQTHGKRHAYRRTPGKHAWTRADIDIHEHRHS
jgi:hypothetical protein